MIGKGAGCTGRMLRHQEGGLAHSQRLASKALVHPRLGVKAAEELLALTRDFVARLVLLRAQPVVPHRVLELLHVLRVVVGEAVHFSPLEPRRRSKGLLLRRLGDVEVVLVPELVARPAPIGAGPLFAGGLQEGGGAAAGLAVAGRVAAGGVEGDERGRTSAAHDLQRGKTSVVSKLSSAQGKGQARAMQSDRHLLRVRARPITGAGVGAVVGSGGAAWTAHLLRFGLLQRRARPRLEQDGILFGCVWKPPEVQLRREGTDWYLFFFVSCAALSPRGDERRWEEGKTRSAPPAGC